MFEYWYSISYRRVIFWTLLLLFLLGAGLLLYNREFLQEKLEKRIAAQHEPTSKKPARFIEIHGTVNVKKVGRQDWIPAEKVEELHPGDLIQTLKDSSAKIVFFDGSTSTFGPDSLNTIVESHETQDQRRSINVEVTSGKTELATGKKKSKSDKTALSTPELEARLEEDTEAEASYSREQKQSNFYVYAGGASVSTREEKPSTHPLQARQGLTFRGKEKESTFNLPPGPQLISPPNTEVLTISRRAIELQWKAVDGIETYQVTVSEAGKPSSPVVFERVRGTRHRLPPLSEGIYFWEIQSANSEGHLSKSNQVFKFALQTQPMPGRRGAIRLDIVRVLKIGEVFEVVGQTDPGVSLEINGEFVQVEGDGSFKHFTKPLPPGVTEITILAKDLSGISRSLKYDISKTLKGK